MENEQESFEVRRRKHAQGYGPQPAAPAMRTWKPVLTEQEKKDRDQSVIEHKLPF